VNNALRQRCWWLGAPVAHSSPLPCILRKLAPTRAQALSWHCRHTVFDPINRLISVNLNVDDLEEGVPFVLISSVESLVKSFLNTE
jgi:hypothetical protein